MKIWNLFLLKLSIYHIKFMPCKQSLAFTFCWNDSIVMQAQKEHTLNSLINEYARLAFWKNKSTILSIFHATNEKNFRHSFIFHVINEIVSLPIRFFWSACLLESSGQRRQPRNKKWPKCWLPFLKKHFKRKQKPQRAWIWHWLFTLNYVECCVISNLFVTSKNEFTNSRI